MGRSCSSVIGSFSVVMMILLEFATATEYIVGDSFGWRIPNSTDFYNDVWAKNKTFLIGDRLVFKWSTFHNVADVPKEQYEKCGTAGNANPTSPVMVNLTANGTRYFICTVGPHCTLGQKLEIKVGHGMTPPSASAPPSAAAPPSLAPLPLLFTLAISLLNFHA